MTAGQKVAVGVAVAGAAAAALWAATRSGGADDDSGTGDDGGSDDSAGGGDGGAPPGAPPVKVPDPENAYALARVATSEEGGKSELVRSAVMWAVINHANRLGKSPADVIKQKRSYYGYGPQSDGSYVSSAQEAAARDVELAGRVVAGSVADPTEGAEWFDDPQTQDWQYAHGNGNVKKSADDVATERLSEGKRVVYLAGEDPRQFRLWTKHASGNTA